MLSELSRTHRTRSLFRSRSRVRAIPGHSESCSMCTNIDRPLLLDYKGHTPDSNIDGPTLANNCHGPCSNNLPHHTSCRRSSSHILPEKGGPTDSQSPSPSSHIASSSPHLHKMIIEICSHLPICRNVKRLPLRIPLR